MNKRLPVILSASLCNSSSPDAPAVLADILARLDLFQRRLLNAASASNRLLVSPCPSTPFSASRFSLTSCSYSPQSPRPRSQGPECHFRHGLRSMPHGSSQSSPHP